MNSIEPQRHPYTIASRKWHLVFGVVAIIFLYRVLVTKYTQGEFHIAVHGVNTIHEPVDKLAGDLEFLLAAGPGFYHARRAIEEYENTRLGQITLLLRERAIRKNYK
jgi:hypothetical protein